MVRLDKTRLEMIELKIIGIENIGLEIIANPSIYFDEILILFFFYNFLCKFQISRMLYLIPVYFFLFVTIPVISSLSY